MSTNNKMNAKKVLSFLLCTPAFTRRNITSLMLVGAFFFIYILAGGKIDTQLPNPRNASTFGGVDLGTGLLNNNKTDASQILGEETPSERRKRETASHMKGRIFTNEDADFEPETIEDKSALIQGRYKSPESIYEKRALEKSERKAPDPFDAIEERLRQRR